MDCPDNCVNRFATECKNCFQKRKYYRKCDNRCVAKSMKWISCICKVATWGASSYCNCKCPNIVSNFLILDGTVELFADIIDEDNKDSKDFTSMIQDAYNAIKDSKDEEYSQKTFYFKNEDLMKLDKIRNFCVNNSIRKK